MRMKVASKYGVFKHGPGYKGVPSLRVFVPHALGLEPLVQRGSLVLLHDQDGAWIAERWSGYFAWLAFELTQDDFKACPGNEPPPPTALEVYQTWGTRSPEEIRRLGVNESLGRPRRDRWRRRLGQTADALEVVARATRPQNS